MDDDIGGSEQYSIDSNRRRRSIGSCSVDYKKYVEKEKENGKLCRLQLRLQQLSAFPRIGFEA